MVGTYIVGLGQTFLGLLLHENTLLYTNIQAIVSNERTERVLHMFGFVYCLIFYMVMGFKEDSLDFVLVGYRGYCV